MKLEKVLTSLISKEVLGKEIDEKAIVDTLRETTGMLEALYELSKMHDLAHIVCLGLKNIGFWEKSEVFAKFQRQQSLAVYRVEQLKYEFERVRCVFERENICYMPLKGACIRELYPMEWMRTSCDVDILVKKENVKRAQELLLNECGYEATGRFETEISFLSKTGICIELHYVESRDKAARNKTLLPSDIWENAVFDENSCRAKMSNELFYFHHVTHTARHFKQSGCGMRAFLDIYLLRFRRELDYATAEKLLNDAGYDKAEKAFVNVAKVWFDGEESDELCRIIRKHVLMGGVCGNQVSRTRLEQRNNGGKLKNLLSLVVPSFEVMKKKYPVLEKKKWMLAACHVRRWWGIIVHMGVKRTADVMNVNLSFSQQEIDEISRMFLELGM